MTQEQRITYWQKLVKAHNQSNRTVTDFCRDHQINRQSFYRWRQHFKSDQSTAQAAGAFLELVPASKNGESGIRLRIDADLAIELDCGFDPSTLGQVISIVKRSCLP
jgi:transposase-like protein